MAEKTGDEWKEISEEGEVCGIVGCLNPPTSQCPKCKNHYCYEHLGAHAHVVTDEEVADHNRRDENLR